MATARGPERGGNCELTRADEEVHHHGVTILGPSNLAATLATDASLLYARNVLNLLDLGGVPVRAAEREAAHPIVLAGGHATYNPDPMADFVDAFAIGEGEEVIVEVARCIEQWKREHPAQRATQPQAERAPSST